MPKQRKRAGSKAGSRSWTDEVFSLFITGHLRSLSAGEVCRAIEWISDEPSLLDPILEVSGREREIRLATLVSERARVS
jgi:hypothetical protein